MKIELTMIIGYFIIFFTKGYHLYCNKDISTVVIYGYMLFNSLLRILKCDDKRFFQNDIVLYVEGSISAFISDICRKILETNVLFAD